MLVAFSLSMHVHWISICLLAIQSVYAITFRFFKLVYVCIIYDNS